ncbi:hypothetical protein HJG54_32370 [Leptolyngbya sp. NK1-12]|uniref:Outer membrane protein beta-barrel domain-containing protein n=1 Tax=Leptolyngbya sp. NK1-12 TaxID=2547451 RepID=A0AA96WQY7_9CYAN|nr:hypothetical protein [Leptolyngbya sp. NK1-12]MBF2050174.1 hypothetical protein [Elainella sp. C42_A2020_010]RNJ65534.1 MAG: hypothetical protein EDM05_30590 [Leptolyngbya sp. IPPAS B-1204]WNZ27566.1 hypothetical protein HJG54_32370 [Leptolyngbya sp. NK1-12]
MRIKLCQPLVILLSSTTLSVLFGALLGVTAVQAAPESSLNDTPVSTSARDLDNIQVSQAVTPGRATRSGPSYVGVGGNLGFGGDTALGETNFTIFSKIGLTRNFSARPSVVVGSDPTILLPLTADLPIGAIAEDIDFAVAPFVGGGLAISTGSDSLARPLITGGIDIPVADRVTVVAQGNVAFFRDTEGSVIIGVGYNF